MNGGASVRGDQSEWAELEREADAMGEAFGARVRAEAGGFLDGVSDVRSDGPAGAIAPDADVAWLAGAVPGVRVVREIGRGGMGVVYEGVEDGTGRRVAVKLLQPERRTPGLVRRLHREAQALARIEHPGVTRLYSTGLCAAPMAGSPYIVMELVHGRQPLRYAETHSLDVRERAALAMRIAEAVGAAHEQGVLHLDLKPGNVLVREDGTVKVLDFGVARVLEEGAGGATMTFLTHPFGSMDSMAPEQFQGRAGSRASDVYALGSLLHRLLTGKGPHDVEGAPLAEAARRVATAAPASARRLNRSVPRELDVIVRTALATDPRHRYPDAGALAADLGRFLRREPIIARRPSAWRRTRAYAARRPALVASIVVASTALLLGAGVATGQAVRAMHAESRALERFEDVRSLANAVIYELHDAIEDLPGSTLARRALVERALEYLDRLASDPNADANLRLELAEAYLSIAVVQGDVSGANLGDFEGRRRSLAAAIGLLERLSAEQPEDHDVALAVARAGIMDFHERSRRSWTSPIEEHDESEVRGRYHELADSVQAMLYNMLRDQPDNLSARTLLADLAWRRGTDHNSWHEIDEAIKWLGAASEMYEELRSQTPDDFKISFNAARVMYGHGYVRTLNGFEGGAEMQREARRRALAMLEDRPWSVSLKQLLSISTSRLAFDLLNEGKYDEALTAIEEARGVAASLTQSDPHSMLWHRLHSVIVAWHSDILALGAEDASLPLQTRMERAREAVAARAEANDLLQERIDRGWLPEWESHYPERWRAAMERYDSLLSTLESELPGA